MSDEKMDGCGTHVHQMIGTVRAANLRMAAGHAAVPLIEEESGTESRVSDDDVSRQRKYHAIDNLVVK